MNPIVFYPIVQERVWGGRGLERHLGRSLPDDKKIGESWEIVDRPETCSRITTGRFTGKTLREALRADSTFLMGPDWDPEKPFPILVKWLDCAERLSLQVHPPAAVADELGGQPKTENWYVAACHPGAALLVGLQEGVTKEQFEEGIRTNTLEPLVRRFTVKPGDSMFVPSGRIHAIDGGNIILEIQQNSDTTYRVYDWGRPREIHVEESLQSIDFSDTDPQMLHTAGETGETVLVDDPVFRLRKITLKPGGEPLVFEGETEPRILSVVEGTIQETGRNLGLLVPGDNALLPWAVGYRFEAVEPAAVLVTDRFAS